MLVEPRDTIIGIIKEYLYNNCYSPLPGKVVSVSDYNSKQTVDVEISVNRKYTNGDITLEAGSTIYGVPFVNPGAGGGVTTYPVKVGNSVLLVFGMRGIETWLLGDGTEASTPDEPRYMSSSDAIAIPGLCTISTHQSPHPDNTEIKFKDILLSLQPDNTFITTNGSVTLTYSPDGTITETNGNYTRVISPDGTITETNPGFTRVVTPSGDMTQTGGTFNLNGFIINSNGSASSPVSVTAPEVSGTSSLLAAGAEVVAHTHGGVESGGSNTNPLA